MKITDLAKLFNRDPELINDDQLAQLHDWAMQDVAIWTLKRHANDPQQPRAFANAVERYNAYTEEQFSRADLAIAARKAG